MTDNLKKREQEQAYLLLKEPQALIKTLLEIENLGGYDLGPATVHSIVDTYMDTVDSDLRLQTVTLRKREIDGQTLLTFKGKEKAEKKVTQDHSEWEFEWPFDLNKAIPEVLFEAAGLVPVQKRETTRVSRDLYANDKRVAEMNIDSSLYTVSTGQAKIYELEFAREGKQKIKSIVKPIEQEIGDWLTPWQHGKFVTGKAIEFAFGVKKDENTAVITPESIFFIDKMFEELTVK